MGDHHRRQPHAAAPVNRDPLTCCNAALRNQRAERGGEATAQARGGHAVDRLWQPHEVGIREIDCNVLGKRTPSCESGLELVRTHLVIP
jgi:hypothetical protein